MTAEESIHERYARVLDEIRSSARSAGRDPDEVRLVVVTKTHPLEAVRAVVEAGARYLGENYAEEALPKIQAIGGRADVEWHMIGHIQSRKARLVCEHFQFVHSLDGAKLAGRLDRSIQDLAENPPAEISLTPTSSQPRRLPVLLECNISGEESKYGFPAWQEEAWPELLADFEAIACFRNLEVRGLMAMAPFSEAAEAARPYFRRLRRLQAFLFQSIPGTNWSELSMGMSGDFQVAIQEGATWVRIGTAILGTRT
jgi:pyridoxal phosphate enzyme (YggS family)